MTKQTTPAIRFRGFDGEWEEKKLGDLGKVAMNKRIFKEETVPDGEIPFYKIGTFGGVADSFISREKFEEYRVKYPYPKEGDLLLSASGSIGRVVEYDGEEAYYQDSNIVWLEHDERLENSFLKQFYSFVKWEGIEGTTIKRLYNKNIMDTKIVLPESTEQSAIGSLFQTLDELLSAYKGNLANYQAFKASMLSKMFPKAGQTTPEIRLDGFDGEWNLDKFGNYLTESRIKGNTGANSKKLTVKLWGKGVVSKEEIYSGSENTQYFKRLAGQFIYSKLDFQNQAFGIIPKELDCFESTLDVPSFDIDKLDKKFLIEYVMRRSFYEYQGLIANGSRKAKRIQPDDFMEMPLLLPSSEEQRAIGSFFSSLDNLISSYQEKITQLETLKKKLLQDMFV
ncbi:restriction endonuclease subunit S [Streptococcus orisasini]|uniref:restriction endonuclease subunit S n=1 Tax=Streptococcus orisasini TaxID=1080071 RepID=UPI000709F331|nr:restriction endonuclease subunit S [Streptococcus orisasini]